ncbi:hypothetical protein [Bradyrhizobium sp. AUGA SZCCT0431]|uniref:hypothetical protein n=1 Tax=Bradyrhizobium sp. AUGA SZCCT0431 TaxID=2807674 RepID=UPI001BACB954|nr:hypothetical protein [Bradyrhizobium sp. AUGA SZCCT0431]MBR1147216.1 hypothetical protein [Bradyrhizobium sp. AUGA SZCCT0431]
MKRLLYAAIALLGIQCSPASADQNCMTGYYRTKQPACVDSVLSQMRAGPNADPSAVIGFLAQIFSTSPAEKQRILQLEASSYVKSVKLVALYGAGLTEDAQKFAEENQITATLQKIEKNQPARLAVVRPSSNAADNDLLIGAYMASGDTNFIERILANFSSADDDMAGIAMRMGFMKSKFGPNMTVEGRDNVMARMACDKYQCKTEPAKFFRVLTLASGFWALQSLSSADDGIKKTFTGFFANDPRLKNLFAAEEAAMGNYMTAYAMVAVFKPEAKAGKSARKDDDKTYESMNKAASAFENLEPAGKVFEHIDAYVKAGKKLK